MLSKIRRNFYRWHYETGIQAINRMFGENDGFMRGESWVIGALQHNFKSGFLMTILKGLVTYNKPLMLNKKEKTHDSFYYIGK